MVLTTAQARLVEQRIANEAQSVGLAYVIWFFAGFLGVHRFYLRRPVSGLFMLFTLGGLLIWWFIDMFLIPGMARKNSDLMRQRLSREIEDDSQGLGGAVEKIA